MVTGGSLSALSGSGLTRTATFTPTEYVAKQAADTVAEAAEERLPLFYDEGIPAFLARIDTLDPAYRFRWINVSAKNQQLKRYKGWEPLEDKVRIAKYGFDPQRHLKKDFSGLYQLHDDRSTSFVQIRDMMRQVAKDRNEDSIDV